MGDTWQGSSHTIDMNILLRETGVKAKLVIEQFIIRYLHPSRSIFANFLSGWRILSVTTAGIFFLHTWFTFGKQQWRMNNIPYE